jgi:hypothetical protein
MQTWHMPKIIATARTFYRPNLKSSLKARTLPGQSGNLHGRRSTRPWTVRRELNRLCDQGRPISALSIGGSGGGRSRNCEAPTVLNSPKA